MQNWIFRCLSFVLGLTFIFVTCLTSFEASFNNALLIFGGSFVLLYSRRPILILKNFKLYPDKDVVEENKKDLKLTLNIWRTKKGSCVNLFNL